MEKRKSCKISEIQFICTSCCCPEQYNVYAKINGSIRDSLVGYVRIRDHRFTVNIVDPGTGVLGEQIVNMWYPKENDFGNKSQRQEVKRFIARLLRLWFENKKTF